MGNSVSSAFHNSSAFYNKCLGVFYFSVIPHRLTGQDDAEGRTLNEE